jgi:diacylglycerol O-acyltransferase
VPTIDRLSALDAAFLDLETDQAPLHVGWTIRVDGPPPPVSALRRHIDGRLDMVPRFRRRVVRRAFGDPQWVDDAAFDIARHVHAVTLAPPAGAGELRALAGALLSRPLDPSRPLWRLYLVDGLATGDWAVIGQAHHALVDGIAAVEVAMLLFDVVGRRAQAGRVHPWSPRPAPPLPLAAASYARHRVAGAARVARTAGRAIGRGGDLPGAVARLAAPAPATALDRSATRRRIVAFASTSLPATREAGRRHGATVNDILLTTATLALGPALRRRGEAPEAVKALVPVNLRAARQHGAFGNRISFVTARLPVDESDPLAALQVVRGQMRTSKAGGGAAPIETLAEVADLLPSGARRVIARTATRAAPFNAVVSNVPGPPVELELMGRRVTAIFPAVPFLHGHALSIGALSYRDRLQCGLYADAEVVPDAVEIARDLESAFDALRVARPHDTPWRARARARRQRAAKR